MTDTERDALLGMADDMKDLKKANFALCGAVIVEGILLALHIVGWC